jgi:ferrous iron transport protein B
MVSCVATLFFGWKGLWILPLFFALAMGHMALTLKLFRVQATDYLVEKSAVPDGPPSLRPQWRPIFSDLGNRMTQLLGKSLPVILGTTVLLWIFTRAIGEWLDPGPLHRLGEWVDSLGAIFGLHWKLLLVLFFAIINREAALGALAVLFCEGSGPWNRFPLAEDLPRMQLELLRSITPAQALAFLTAFFFNVPCCAAIAATIAESQSRLWTLKLGTYYLSMALLFATAIFHLSHQFFG